MVISDEGAAGFGEIMMEAVAVFRSTNGVAIKNANRKVIKIEAIQVNKFVRPEIEHQGDFFPMYSFRLISSNTQSNCLPSYTGCPETIVIGTRACVFAFEGLKNGTVRRSLYLYEVVPALYFPAGKYDNTAAFAFARLISAVETT